MKIKITELTPKGTILRIIRKLSVLDRLSQSLMTTLATNQNWCKKLNESYNKLSFDEKNVFHSIFYKTFRDDKLNAPEGIWTVIFLGKKIKLPLRKESAWLDWENAVSIVGHDTDVKITYETLLKSENPPATFFDVGANYGTHSLLFLTQGVTTISFEPNPACKEQFEIFCQLNELDGKLENVAVGNGEGTVDFWFPEKATWFGTILENSKDNFSHLPDLKKMQVPLITLDSYVKKSGISPDLIKIDTEGNEVNVIKGAVETITKAKPLIIFECNILNDKNQLWKIFEELDYSICTLPLLQNSQPTALNQSEFLSHEGFNLIAVPNSHSIFSGNLKNRS
jgi:FkbM family methyltransferase